MRWRGLLALGLGAGDHVVLWMPNRVEWNIANLGIAKAAAVTVTCNSRYKAFEVEYLLRQSDAKALILVDRFGAAAIDYLENPPGDLSGGGSTGRDPSAEREISRAEARGGTRRGRAAGVRFVCGRRAHGQRGGAERTGPDPPTARRPGGDAVHLGHHGRAQGLPALTRQHVLPVRCPSIRGAPGCFTRETRRLRRPGRPTRT